MKFGIHKLWFFYTDEWYVTEGKLATQVGLYDTLEEAQAALRKLDIQGIRAMNSYDYIRDLTGFMEREDYQGKVKNLLNYARAIGWEDSIRTRDYANSDKVYHQLSIPTTASDEQIGEILDITGAYFHKIIEYTNVKKSAYIKFNYDFWGSKVFKALKEEKLIADRGPYIQGVKVKGKYFLQKSPKGRKSATIRNIEEGLAKAIETSLKAIKEFPVNNFLGKTYTEELSDSPILLMNYLKNCKTIKLEEELVDSKNLKKITARLKKLKSNISLTEGQRFFYLSFPEVESIDVKEVQGFFQLLKTQPFTVYEMYAEINGEEVYSYYPEHGTF